MFIVLVSFCTFSALQVEKNLETEQLLSDNHPLTKIIEWQKNFEIGAIKLNEDSSVEETMPAETHKTSFYWGLEPNMVWKPGQDPWFAPEYGMMKINNVF